MMAKDSRRVVPARVEDLQAEVLSLGYPEEDGLRLLPGQLRPRHPRLAQTDHHGRENLGRDGGESVFILILLSIS